MKHILPMIGSMANEQCEITNGKCSGRGGGSRTHTLSFMRRMLFPLELLRKNVWKPAEELNLVPFRPTLQRFGLEDRCRDRGPWSAPAKRSGDGALGQG
jgi:hypothetical protein